jgi:preprotein translocase subunit SecD
VRQQRLEAMEESVRNKLKTTDATIRISDISNNNGSLTFLVTMSPRSMPCAKRSCR